MAGTEIKEAIRSAGDAIAGYIKDVATLTVDTRTAEVGVVGEPVLAARTVISFDGDNDAVVPARRNEQGHLKVDTALYEIHMQNVSAAIEYRARLLAAMLDLLKSRNS